ncbi:MAG: GTPase Era [Bacteroidetes bacterium]|nr:MAG: GTPase Era [Bacteroidota bacterium]
MNESEHIPVETTNSDFKAGYTAIIGEPNVGKSTLLNALLRQKISIVTKKPQTTRHKILGILTENKYQIVFLDTPGLLKPKYRLQEAMMKFAMSAIQDADTILVMVDASATTKKLFEGEDNLFKMLKEKNLILLVNKIDTVEKQVLPSIIMAYENQLPFKAVLLISAIKREGIKRLKEEIVNLLPVHPPYYPSDSISEQSERFFVCEIIREKIFEQFREEIPYSTTVDIIEFEERKDKKDNIHAEIYVERDSQKAILIGKRGVALKAIGIAARKDIEKLLGRGVFLHLYVKVRERWREDEAWLKRLGYGDP